MGPTDPRAPAAGPRWRAWRVSALLVLLALAVGLYLQRPRPGRSVLTYRIGAVDPRFGLGRDEVAQAAGSAVAIWRAPVARALFREDPRGDIVINLVYDQRQAGLDQLRTLDRGIASAKGPLDELRARYEGLRAGYEQKRDGLRADAAAYQAQVAAFNAENENLRRHGDATENEVHRLGSERAGLEAARAALARREQELEEARGALNEAAQELNGKLAGQRDQVASYQAAGNRLPDEFDEGEYVRRLGKQTINVFCFKDPQVLVRVLAHELGHALGLGHGTDPQALMYPLVLSGSLELAPEDIAAIKALCGVP